MLKVLFMGTPDFSRDSLKAIKEAGHEIVGVFTVPDKPKGRGMKMILSPVKEYALEENLEIYQPTKLRKNEEIYETIKKLNPDIICVVAYGKLLPKEILEIPRLGSINVHPSLLPKYRGSAPIQWSIINGDKKTGVTIMYLSEEMDAGDIILQEETKIKEDETSGELWERLSKMGAELLLKALKDIENKTANRIPQGEKYTLAPMIEKEMSHINWQEQTAEQITNLARGLDPIMGTYTYLNNKKIKLWKTEKIDMTDFINEYKEFGEYEYKLKEVEPGTIIYINNKKGIYVKTKDGILLIKEIQVENAKRMKTTDFLRGNKIEVANKFE